VEFFRSGTAGFTSTSVMGVSFTTTLTAPFPDELGARLRHMDGSTALRTDRKPASTVRGDFQARPAMNAGKTDHRKFLP